MITSGLLEPQLRTPPFGPLTNWTANSFDRGTAPADGAALSTWRDTVNDYVATQGTVNNQPAYKLNSDNGYPAEDVAGQVTARWFICPAAFDSQVDKNNCTFFFVTSKNSPVASDSVGLMGLAGGTVSNRMAMFWFNGSLYLDKGNALAAQRLILASPATQGVWYRWGFRVTGGSNLNIWADGVNLGSNNNGGNPSPTAWDIGNRGLATSQISWENRRSLVYNYSLSDSQMSAVFNFLEGDLRA